MFYSSTPSKSPKKIKIGTAFNLCCDCLPNITLPNANLNSEGIAFCLLVIFYIQVAVIYEIYKHVCIYIYVFVCIQIFICIIYLYRSLPIGGLLPIFALIMNLQLSLMLVSNAEAYQSGAPERRIPRGWANGLTCKDQASIERLVRGKHCSLLRKSVNYGCKKFYSTSTQAQCYKKFYILNLRIFAISLSVLYLASFSILF